MDDCRKRQTSTATPAEPGDLPWGLARSNRSDLTDSVSRVAPRCLPLGQGPQGRHHPTPPRRWGPLSLKCGSRIDLRSPPAEHASCFL